MPLDERKRRHAELYEALLANDVSKWGDKFLKALGPQGGKKARDAAVLRGFIGSEAIVPTIPPASRQ